MSNTLTDTFALTDLGRVRKNNEDAVLMIPSLGCYAVSDGMGGGKAGEVASAMMVREIESSMKKVSGIPGEREGCVIRSAYKVNYQIKDYAEEHRYSSMGATMVCLLLDPWHPCTATVFHAGDSRAYRIREGKMTQLMEDHTVAMSSMVPENKIAPMFRGVLTNALGTGMDFYLERNSVDVQENDMFLVCSDGLTRMLTDSEILQICTASRDASSEVIAKNLLDMVLANGGRDNVSIILLKILRLGDEYTPTAEESQKEADAQIRNLMDLSDTPETEVRHATQS